MPLDPRILLQRTTPDLLSALQGGIAAGQAIRQAPLMEALQKQDLAQRQAQEQRDAALAPLQQQLLNAQIARQSGPPSGVASAKTEILPDGSVVQALPSGEVQVRNPQGDIVTGEARTSTLKGAQQFKIEEQQQEANIAVNRAQSIARASAREQRTSTLKSELSTRNRNAARESIRLSQALTIASEADQGITGSTRLKLAKLFPNIDASNEALLDQSLTQLALDQLQNFKGPTTDFEFGVTESITGQLGDAKSANVAKLKSLSRANWFNKREFDQFTRHVNSGGDPDAFSFNFGEPIRTKKGVFTLQDLQDTAVHGHLSIDEVLKELNK